VLREYLGHRVRREFLDQMEFRDLKETMALRVGLGHRE
jgi:hypothetical protein